MDVMLDTLRPFGGILCILTAFLLGGLCAFSSKSGSSKTTIDDGSYDCVSATCPECDGDGVIQDLNFF